MKQMKPIPTPRKLTFSTLTLVLTMTIALLSCQKELSHQKNAPPHTGSKN
jgi:hypothetical protein